MTSALAIIALTESPPGPMLIALEEPAQSMLLDSACCPSPPNCCCSSSDTPPGSVTCKTPMTLILSSNAQTRVSATARTESANASPTTRASPASARYAPTAAATLASASPRSSWPLKLAGPTLHLGTPTSKWDVCVIWAEEAQTALYVGPAPYSYAAIPADLTLHFAVECPSGPDVLKGYGSEAGRDCSGRGLCDYSSGICNCFHGYYGTKCEFQTVLG